MNREIKFRAWWPSVKKMVYFDKPYIGNSALDEWALMFNAKEGKVYLGLSELEEFTGYQYSDGQDSYEGDSVKWLTNRISEGVIKQGLVDNLAYDAPGFNGWYVDCGRFSLSFGDGSSFEKIGTIHDEPVKDK